MIEPDVSVPIVSVESPAAAAAPEPEEEPLGPAAVSSALSTWPVRLLNPEGWLPKLLAHSDRPSLPRMMTPWARSSFATPESTAGNDSRSAQSPAEVYMGVASMMSLSRIGRPMAGPKFLCLARSLSISLASAIALGLICVTALSPGPALFRAWIRAS